MEMFITNLPKIHICGHHYEVYEIEGKNYIVMGDKMVEVQIETCMGIGGIEAKLTKLKLAKQNE